ncbi:MAG: helix-turn-helix transcriptional regulator [Salinivenus sp.]
MRPSERWPAILLQLDSDAWKRAEDLAQTLGVSERTVYRDVQAMVEAGVPLQGVPGKGYRVPDDYLLEPITLSTDEAVMLVLGSAYAAQNVEGRYRVAAQSAQEKLHSVLPDEDWTRAFSLQGSVSLVPPSAFGPPTSDLLLRRIRQALVEERALAVTLDGDTDERRLHPYGLVQQGGMWYVVGHAPDRDRVVHLRLSDVHSVTLTDRRFDRPASYRTPPDGAASPPDRELTVRVAFDADVASAVQVAPSLRVTEREQQSDGRLLLTLKVHHEREVLPWLLGWGRHAYVLAPRSLRERIAAEARAAAEQYRSVPTLLDAASPPDPS